MRPESLRQSPQPPIREPLSLDERALAESYALRRDEERLSMEDSYFAKVKSSERLAADRSEVKRLEAKFVHDDESLLASAFEYVLQQRLNGPSHWLGERVKAQLTTPFDDYRNGIDLYVEDVEQRSGRPIGLSIDITFSTDPRNIGGKIRDLKEKLLTGGRLAQLSYYKPLNPEAAPEPRDMLALPKVVIGVERERAIEAMGRLREAEHEGTEEKQRDWVTGLTVLYQISKQLKAYLWYSETQVDRAAKPHVEETIACYKEALKDIEGIFQTMKLDHAKVREFARQSTVTNVLEAQLAQEIGYQRPTE